LKRTSYPVAESCGGGGGRKPSWAREGQRGPVEGGGRGDGMALAVEGQDGMGVGGGEDVGGDGATDNARETPQTGALRSANNGGRRAGRHDRTAGPTASPTARGEGGRLGLDRVGATNVYEH